MPWWSRTGPRASALLVALGAAALLPASGQPPAAAAMLPRSAPAASALPAPTTLPAPTAQQNAPTTPQNGRGDPVVLLGTAGLRWEDADAGTPTLRSLLSGAATGVITVRSLRDRACPADGWLAVSAGRRAADEPGAPGEPGCRVLRTGPGTAGGEVAVPRWETYRREAAEASFDAEPGTLGRALARGALTSAAIGPGAQIALADGDGRVGRAWPGLPADERGGIAPRTSATELKGQVAEALALGPDLLAVDLGTIVDPPGPVPGSPPAPRADQVRALDARLRLVLGELPENSTVVVASLASGGEKAHLQLGAVLGPVPDGGTYSSALLTSRSTRQSGLVQSTDVTPTLLEALDLPRPAQVVGSPLRPTGRDTPEDRRWQRLVDLDLASQAVLPIVPWFFTVFVSLQFLVLCALVVPLRRAHRAAPRRPAVVHGTRWFATACAAVPAAAYLANLYPWWRSAVPEATLPLAVLCATVPLTAVALLGPWRSAFLGPPGAIGALTALVLGADALSGSQLMLIGLIGEQPLIAGRFYGFGNPAFALFASGALLAALALADGLLRRGRRRAAVLAVVIIGLLATVLDGTPGIGSDFGGPPAMIPAFGLLAARTAGVRLSLRRIAALGGLTLSAVLALSLLDHSRPAADRTHLGAFVATALDGGAWPVIRRKALQNLELLMTPPAFLLPVAVLFVALVLYRPLAWRAPWLQLAYERSPLLRSGVAALGVLVLIGFAMNDSGTAVPAVTMLLVLPLLVATAVRAQDPQDSEEGRRRTADDRPVTDR